MKTIKKIMISVVFCMLLGLASTNSTNAVPAAANEKVCNYVTVTTCGTSRVEYNVPCRTDRQRLRDQGNYEWEDCGDATLAIQLIIEDMLRM
jgi:hypothetical protein